MSAPLPVREARRIFVITLAARLMAIAVAGGLARVVWPDTVGRVLSGEMVTLAFGGLVALSLVEFLLQRHHLALALGLDIFFLSMRFTPALLSPRLAHLARVGQTLEIGLVEPFVFLLIPLVLLAWAYGRRGALWGSGWAVSLYLLNVVLQNVLAREAEGYFFTVIVRSAFVIVLPLIVSVLAERERRHIEALTEAHARLQRHAATVEQLAVSRERNRMARDLHDTLTHSLAALSVHLDALRILMQNDLDAAQQAADEALAMARQGLADARQAIQALRRDPVGTLGLVEAARSELEAFRARSGVAAELTTAGSEPDLDDEESHVLYRIVQEALRNVERHADATEVHMHIEGSDERVQMVVSDNGLGFEPHAVPGDRYGLLGMQERAAMVGAELDIRTHPGGGTDIVCTLER